MNIQIIGNRKSSESRKAERFFQERGISFQFVDLKKRGLSPGELENISRLTGVEDLLDTESPAYKKRGLAYMTFDTLEELEEDPSLIRTPIVRMGKHASVGYVPDQWTRWLEET